MAIPAPQRLDTAPITPLAGNPAAATPSNGHAADHAVVQEARLGNASAWAQLVDGNAARLYAMLVQLCRGDADMASELVQEAFVRAWERLDRFDGASSFGTWLYRLARNRAIDVLARRRPQAADEQTLVHAAGSKSVDPAADLERQETKTAITAALAQLEPESREIILLRDFDGLDYSTIAERLDLAEGTVKSRLHRARACLRELLRPMAGDLA